MKNRLRIIPTFIIALTLLILIHSEARAQYTPFGPQMNVPVATVTNGGWTECYRDTYSNFMNVDQVLADCAGDQLMLACRQTGSPTLMLLAWGNRSDVTFDTGLNLGVTHIANGVGWYFNSGPPGQALEGQNAWGFVTAGQMVNKDNCDFQTPGNDRLCWHLQEDIGGYRCGNVGDGDGSDLNSPPDGDAYERIVYVLGDVPPAAAQVPTLSEWGLIAMAGVLGLVGFMVMRRKRATA